MFNYTMTNADKQKIAGFIDLAGDFLTSGYKSGHVEYNFFQNEIKTNTFNASHESDSLEKIASVIIHIFHFK